MRIAVSWVSYQIRMFPSKLIEEKIPDDEKENWYEQFDQAEDTWEMSMIIDRLMKLKK